MLPKALWIKQEEPDIWKKAAYICEKQDYCNWLLTGELVASACNTAARWHYDGDVRPVNLLKLVGLDDLLVKWPQRVVRMGERVGLLTADSAALLGGLNAGTPVIQGGPDAYVGMLGLGVLEPRKLALITGSSHLHLCVSDRPNLHGTGFWGSYRDAPLQGLCFAEGGQSSTGSLLQWAKRLLAGSQPPLATPVGQVALSFATLDAEAEAVPAGAEGLLSLETFQGSRTPETDPKARGALVGLSLFHGRGHVWRAFLEGICLGTRNCIASLAAEGLGADELVIGGGATKSEFFLQLHADVTGLPVVVTECSDNAPLLGCAVLAAAGAGLFPSPHAAGSEGVLEGVRRAAKAMVRERRRVLPNPALSRVYDDLYPVYKGLGPLLRSTAHSLVNLAGGDLPDTVSEGPEPEHSHNPRVVVVPSLLAADFGHLAAEAGSCAKLGATWLHIDVCDGGEAAQGALTLGPQAVAAIARAAGKGVRTDVHICAARPGALIAAFAEAGATRLTLQYELLATPEVLAVGPHALTAVVSAVCSNVRAAGMSCGLVLAPETPVDVLLPLEDLLSGPDPVVEFVDILAVRPGVGNQKANMKLALEKVAFVRRKFPVLPFVGVDGGVNENTISQAVAAGANFLICGTAIFGAQRRHEQGEERMRSRMIKLTSLAIGGLEYSNE